MIITIIDYGLSNLLSVQRAVQYLGYEAKVTGDAAEIVGANTLLLPGVGAFKDGMAGLARLGLAPIIRKKAEAGTPLLGICLGMQMLFEESDEFGQHKGLDLIPGRVERIPTADTKGNRQRVPQVGWNGLFPHAGEKNFACPLFASTLPGEEVYFVHSYEAKPSNAEHCLAVAPYGGRSICAAAGKKNVFGTQFHPEKSGTVGLTILKQYLDYAASTWQ